MQCIHYLIYFLKLNFPYIFLSCTCQSYVKSYSIMAEKIDSKLLKGCKRSTTKKSRKKVLDELSQNSDENSGKSNKSSTKRSRPTGQDSRSVWRSKQPKKVCINEAFVNASRELYSSISSTPTTSEVQYNSSNTIESLKNDQQTCSVMSMTNKSNGNENSSKIRSPTTFAVVDCETTCHSNTHVVCNFKFDVNDKSILNLFSFFLLKIWLSIIE